MEFHRVVVDMVRLAYTLRLGPAIFVLVASVFLPSFARADFYTYTDPDGVMHFTNVPTTERYKWVMRERRTGATAGKTTEKKAAFAQGQSQSSVNAISYDDVIYNTSLRFGVDPTLVKAIVKAESDFDSEAVSRAGAKGLMQLMPETARLMGVEDIHDPEENIEGGIKYLSKLLKMFNWQIPLAVAAYNAGENAVLKYGKIPPYSETQDYVQKVMKYHKTYQGSGY